MSKNLRYYTQGTMNGYGNRQHCRKVKRLTERFEESGESIGLAEKLAREDEQVAFTVYQEMRAKRKYDSNRDALLYHYDSKVISGRSKK